MENSQIFPELTLALTNHSICRRAIQMYTLLTGYSLFKYIQSKKEFRDFDIQHMRIITVDSMYIRQMLMKLENNINEICLKSVERSRKKNGEGPLASFTINIQPAGEG